MIVFDLSCDQGHTFEGWFGSSADFASQQARGLVVCPQCGSGGVGKAPMAPAVGRKGNQIAARSAPSQEASVAEPARPMASGELPPEVHDAMRKLAEAQAKALKDSTWVGRDFAKASRAMHYGEQDHAPIHGEASPSEARDLLEEGIAVAPLPFPVAPPDKIN